MGGEKRGGEKRREGKEKRGGEGRKGREKREESIALALLGNKRNPHTHKLTQGLSFRLLLGPESKQPLCVTVPGPVTN